MARFLRLSRYRGIIHLLVVYFVWGSTFLAIRYAVQGPHSFPPFTLAALRVGIAGLILLALAFFRGERLRLERSLLSQLFLTGVLLWVGGHALLIWAAQWADSGYGAILFASIPLWTAVFEAMRDPLARSLKIVFPVILGFIAILILTMGSVPVTKHGISVHTFSSPLLTGVILISAFCWALGSFLHTPATQRLPVSVSAGFQQLFAGMVCALLAVFTGESMVQPNERAWWALGYLTLFGSILAFSSYVRAQQFFPNRIVASFAYVNPVIAIALGYIFAHELISRMMLAGAFLVIISVIWLFNANSELNWRRLRIPFKLRLKMPFTLKFKLILKPKEKKNVSLR
jgi:drug/metabolite transporter (DMT)-like permease